MVLNIKKQHLENYRPAVMAEAITEETCDVIVPDSWPDAERVCGSSGTVMIRAKECMPGKATVSGSAKVWVIYQTAENETRSMSAVLPYTVEIADSSIGESSVLIVKPRLISCEGRVINSRKLQIKVAIAVAVTVMDNSELVYCDGLECECGLEIQYGEYPVLLTKNVKEKNFTLSDELQLDNSKPSFGQMLSSSVALKVLDKKIVGKKLVFKGNTDMDVVYLTSDGSIENAKFELPFSQLIDIDGIEETDIPWLLLTITGCDLEILDDYSENLRRLELNMNVLAQAAVSGQQVIKPVQDFYSTEYQTVSTSPVAEMIALLDNKTVHKNVRERITPDSQPVKILSVSVTMPKKEIAVDGGRVKAKQSLEVSVTYLDQNGIIRSQKKKLDSTAELELAQNAQAEVSCELSTSPSASISGSDIEFDAELEFCFVCTAVQNVNVLSDGEISHEMIDRKAKPSVVLTRAEGELWDIAKKYGAKVSEIMAVNGLEDAAVDGKMILIPKPAGI